MLIILVGPTASGKSALALRLAQHFNGEVISADSQQVYRYFNIGTGKLPLEERGGIPHHLIDMVEPIENFSAAKFVEEADKVIGEIEKRGHQVIVVGGTGLYVKALLYGLFQAPPSAPNIRQAHKQLWLEQGPESFHQRLQEIDPEAAKRICPSDFMRISRALEVFEQTGVPISVLQKQHQFSSQRYPALLIGLAPERTILRKLIEDRVDAMMTNGWLAEVNVLISMGYEASSPMGALGYRHLRSHVRGEIDLAEAIRQTKRDTWRFARRQLTWFANETRIQWFKQADEIDIDQIAHFLISPDH